MTVDWIGAGLTETRRVAKWGAPVAGRSSENRPAAVTNGTYIRQQQRDAREPEPIDDEQTTADLEQTLSDSDQTLSDADQTSSDNDQTSADEDQVAADRDQAASDRDLAGGADPRAHERSHDARERTTRQREQVAHERDRTAQARLAIADRRDAGADARDRAALARDRLAEQRKLAMEALDAAFQRDDEAGPMTGAELIVRGAGKRKRAAPRRRQAAEQRELAAQDRRDAARDRAQAARERLDAMEDREMLADDLQREKELRREALRHQHRAEKLAGTLQRSLSPPRLPAVAGLEVAVHYEPSAPEEVGGDFYDLFPLAAGWTGFFLGDVCGKGPDAAAVTSLARYTMRTAAMLHEEPAAILLDLNAALLMESPASMQTCTVVYGQLDMRSAACAVTLAVAGHPPPLVVRANGGVEWAPADGTMLGAVSDPTFATCAVTLDPDDAIVLCSDGIHDAEIDAVRIDEQRVFELLSGAAQASAQALVDRLVDPLRSARRPLRDDVAIMVLRRVGPANGVRAGR